MLATPLKHRLLAGLAAAACLAACGGSDDGDTTTTTVTLYKHAGSMQCTGGGLELSSMERELVEAGVRVVTASCGNDGTVYPALCGMPDGQIGIFEVAAPHSQAAAVIGFLPLRDKPAAVTSPCAQRVSPQPAPGV